MPKKEPLGLFHNRQQCNQPVARTLKLQLEESEDKRAPMPKKELLEAQVHQQMEVDNLLQ